MDKDLAENLEQKTEKETEVNVELLNNLKKMLETQKAEIDDKEDRLRRLMAEFDNFKKRSAKEREGLYNSLLSDIAVSLLPVIDNLEKAVSVQTDDNNYKVGVELVLKQFKDVLKSNGINEIVLPWTDEGLGIAIKTTGRSYRETEKIASILEKEFGRI